MKQSLQLRMGQQLSMTPQLQQAIKLLQLSTLDLQQEIQQNLDSNMMLEVIEDEKESLNEPKNTTNTDNSVDEINSEGSQTDMPNEFPVDSSWDDVFEPFSTGVNNAVSYTDFSAFENEGSHPETLQEYLRWQIEMQVFTERDAEIALTIVDSVSADGYLNSSVHEIYQGLRMSLEALELDELYAVLHRIQCLDPLGVAAENLQDCLYIQLSRLALDTPFRAGALRLVHGYLAALAAQDQAKLIRRLGVSERELTGIISLIRSLNPKPGYIIENTTSGYVIPDLFVTKNDEGVWNVTLNQDIAPKLRVNPVYSGMIKRGSRTEDNVCMREHLQEARWFIKSLHSRNDTLLRVGKCIVERQIEFLEHGDMAMKPLVLKDIADDLELHESTISRMTNQKYMNLPNGIIELKYFFSSHVSTETGGGCSATAVRAFIKELINNENRVKPLSDQKISDLLGSKGVNAARRTVAKYRESMSIPSSGQRKKVI